MGDLIQTEAALIQMVDGVAMVDSRDVAERFNKQHKDVLKAIRSLETPPEFTERNFAPSEYMDPTGRKVPHTLMTRDGFSLVAMGFTGAAAMQWKVRFIEAFSQLEERVATAPAQLSAPQFKQLAEAVVDLLKERANPEGHFVETSVEGIPGAVWRPIPYTAPFPEELKEIRGDIREALDHNPVDGLTTVELMRLLPRHVTTKQRDRALKLMMIRGCEIVARTDRPEGPGRPATRYAYRYPGGRLSMLELYQRLGPAWEAVNNSPYPEGSEEDEALLECALGLEGEILYRPAESGADLAIKILAASRSITLPGNLTRSARAIAGGGGR